MFVHEGPHCNSQRLVKEMYVCGGERDVDLLSIA